MTAPDTRQRRVLIALAAYHHPVQVTEIRGLLDASPNVVGGVLRGALAHGWVERQQPDRDHSLWRITPAGRDAIGRNPPPGATDA